MADPFPRDVSESEEPKGGRWNRLRGKLLSHRRQSSEEGIPVADEGGLSDFLRPSGPVVQSRRPLGPKLDVSAASRWPKVSQVLGAAPPPHSPKFEKFRYSKPVRRLGLYVTFATSQPEIIGEGGDESDQPVIAVARRTDQGQKYKAESDQPPRYAQWEHDSKTPRYQEREMSALPSYGRRQGAGPRLDNLPHSKGSPPGSTQVPAGNTFPLSAPAVSPPTRTQTKRWSNHQSTPMPSRSDDYFSNPAGSGGSSDNVSPELRLSPPDVSSLSRRQQSSPMQSDQLSTDVKRTNEASYLSAPPSQFKTSRSNSSGSDSSRGRDAFPHRTTRKPVGSGSSSRSPEPGTKRSTHVNDSAAEDPGVFQTPQYPVSLGRSNPSNWSPSRDRAPTGLKPPQWSQSPHSSGDERGLSPDARQATHPRESANQGNERCILKLVLQSYDIVTKDGTSVIPPYPAYPHWRRVLVMVPNSNQHESSQESKGVSVVLYDTKSNFSDRTIGMQRFHLDHRNPTTFRISCVPDPRRTMKQVEGEFDEKLAATLNRLEETATTSETQQIFTFLNPADLHAFQTAITDDEVKHDGACTWSGARKRLLSKAEKPVDARIQVLSGHGKTRLVAFLTDGRAYSAALESSDVYEEVGPKDGGPGVRLVDVKIAPAEETQDDTPGQAHGYIPFHATPAAENGEDILVGFADEAAKASFAAALPAALVAPGKGFSLKRLM